MKTKVGTLIGARVPIELKRVLDNYCEGHGVKLSFFVTQAVKDKLLEVVEDESDIKIVLERLENPGFASQEDFDAYLSRRGLKI